MLRNHTFVFKEKKKKQTVHLIVFEKSLKSKRTTREKDSPECVSLSGHTYLYFFVYIYFIFCDYLNLSINQIRWMIPGEFKLNSVNSII